jgi:hypothetical protein
LNLSTYLNPPPLTLFIAEIFPMELKGMGLGVEGAAGGAALHFVYYETLTGGALRRRIHHPKPRLLF